MRRLSFVFILSLFSLLTFCSRPAENSTPVYFTGDLSGARGKSYDFVDGNVIDCKNVSIKYLRGSVRGNSTGIFVDVMRGDIDGGSVTVNVLEGNIIDGGKVTVNLLIGRDFSGSAKVLKKAEVRDR